ncbi:MAG: glycosyltransferase family 2 protein [Ilumatobacter sp.]
MNAPAHAGVTVVIPAFNAAHTIERAVASVLGQVGGAPPVIVVDDCSNDATATIARDLGAHVVAGVGNGPGGARNIGIQASVTPLVAFCDADDEWASDRLRCDLLDFSTTPDIDILLGLSRYETDDDHLLDGHHFDNDDRCALVPHFGAATMRTDVFDRVGLIDSTRRNFEDYEFFQRARDLGATVVEHRRVTQTRHLVATSTSHRNPPGPNDLLAVLRESVQRRRASGPDTTRKDST